MSGTAVSDAAPGLRLSSARGRWVVTATVLGSGMAALDATVVGIALPSIGRDFHASVSSLQWVVDAYTLTLAGLLLLGSEFLLLLKAKASDYADLESAIRAVHAYEIPEIIGLDIENGSSDYLAWISAVTR